jgi:hypothetical protein
MIIDPILDVSQAKTLDEVIDAQSQYECLNNRHPKRLLFESKVQLRKMFDKIIYINNKGPIIIFGIRAIFKQDIREWEEFRKLAPPTEFWVNYWTDIDGLGFDPLNEALVNDRQPHP